MENELPQPQVLLAVGFVMLKPRLFRSSWKSTVTPLRYNRLRLSMTTETPWISNTSSSLALTYRVEIELVLEAAAAAADDAHAQVQFFRCAGCLLLGHDSPDFVGRLFGQDDAGLSLVPGVFSAQFQRVRFRSSWTYKATPSE